MEYKVLDEKGLRYLDPAQRLVILPKNSIIRQSDIDNRFFSIGGLERLEKDGRVKPMSGKEVKEEEKKEVKADPLNDPISKDNKKMTKGRKK